MAGTSYPGEGLHPLGMFDLCHFDLPKWGCASSGGLLGVQSWSPFLTRKSGHIWRIWAEMTQTLMPKSTKVAQIHLPERNSAEIRQVSAKSRHWPNFRQNSPKFAKFPPKFAKLAKFRFTKGNQARPEPPFAECTFCGCLSMFYPISILIVFWCVFFQNLAQPEHNIRF